jgi:hypothetical protein
MAFNMIAHMVFNMVAHMVFNMVKHMAFNMIAHMAFNMIAHMVFNMVVNMVKHMAFNMIAHMVFNMVVNMGMRVLETPRYKEEGATYRECASLRCVACIVAEVFGFPIEDMGEVGVVELLGSFVGGGDELEGLSDSHIVRGSGVGRDGSTCPHDDGEPHYEEPHEGHPSHGGELMYGITDPTCDFVTETLKPLYINSVIKESLSFLYVQTIRPHLCMPLFEHVYHNTPKRKQERKYVYKVL